MLKSLYVDGHTWLHRLSVKPKLLVLLVVSFALFFVKAPWALALVAALTGSLYFSLGLTMKDALRRLAPVLFTIGVLGLFNLLFLGPLEALASVLRLLAILFLAASVTATVTIADFIDTLTDWGAPLERLGLLKAADVGLAFGLVLRFVPEIAARYESLREAHLARGLPVKPHKMIGPLIISTLKDADAIAEAIDARGIRGQ